MWRHLVCFSFRSTANLFILLIINQYQIKVSGKITRRLINYYVLCNIKKYLFSLTSELKDFFLG